MHAELDTQLKAARRSAPAPRISMGAAFVHGRARGARRARALAAGLHLLLGCALAAITAALWLRPGELKDTAILATSMADVIWLLTWLRLR